MYFYSVCVTKPSSPTVVTIPIQYFKLINSKIVKAQLTVFVVAQWLKNNSTKRPSYWPKFKISTSPQKAPFPTPDLCKSSETTKDCIVLVVFSRKQVI